MEIDPCRESSWCARVSSPKSPHSSRSLKIFIGSQFCCCLHYSRWQRAHLIIACDLQVLFLTNFFFFAQACYEKHVFNFITAVILGVWKNVLHFLFILEPKIFRSIKLEYFTNDPRKQCSMRSLHLCLFIAELVHHLKQFFLVRWPSHKFITALLNVIHRSICHCGR